MPNSEKGQPEKHEKYVFIRVDLPPVRSRGQSAWRRLPPIVPLPPHAISARFAGELDFFRPAKRLLRRDFRVAIAVTIGIWPFDVRFAKIRKLSGLPEARLWRGMREAWPRLFYV
jgi:hypothetical protein